MREHRSKRPLWTSNLAPSGYHRAMGLVACPFCRELFETNEAKHCPVCGIELSALAKLPLSHDAAAEEAVPTLPEQEILPFTFWGRNRGPLAAIALVGIVCFFLPWIRESQPNIQNFTGFDLARKLGWSWAPLMSWLTLFPVVMSRRSIFKMQGARAAAFLMSLFPAATILMLYFKPRPNWVYFTVRYEFLPAFWATLALSVLAVVLSLRFGGSSRVIEAQPKSPSAKRDPSATLH
ncbi:MAG: hypothetical protein U0174_23595 [Polyangiaceae bacterium]